MIYVESLETGIERGVLEPEIEKRERTLQCANQNHGTPHQAFFLYQRKAAIQLLAPRGAVLNKKQPAG